MAFFHEDGLVPAWNFALRYAGNHGHVATLPEIIEARLATQPDAAPWSSYFTTRSAEYYGIGADGREKLIVAHGVGPMSTLSGIMNAYSWEYQDKSRRNNGGRIFADDFLSLEAGVYGKVAVIDVRDYLERWSDAFHGIRSALDAHNDPLLLARLGTLAPDYLDRHYTIADEWHDRESVAWPANNRPYLLQVGGASNCPYTTFPEVNGRLDFTRLIPRRPENGVAIGHLLTISQLTHTRSSGWQGLISTIDCHEWRDGVRFVGFPEGASWSAGIGESLQPYQAIRYSWPRFMRPNHDSQYVPPRLYLLERAGNEWFTRYPKPNDGERADEGDIEFRVRSVREVGSKKQFKTDDMFFLRYNLSRIMAIAPRGANAYRIVDVSTKDHRGLTTVTVEFYVADVDTSQRLPRAKEVKQNYDLLMG